MRQSMEWSLSKPVHLLLRRAELATEPVHVMIQLVEYLDLLFDLGIDGESEVFLALQDRRKLGEIRILVVDLGLLKL